MSLLDFEILSELGSGSFGRVFKAKKKDDKELYAIKQIDIAAMNQRERENALNQIRLLASIHSPYIVSYKDSFFDEMKKNLCIVMEFAEEGDLQKKINDHIKKNTRFKEDEIMSIASNIISGAKMLHQKKILHRDIKAANIFFKNGIAKLGDLNVSRVLKEEKFARTQTGTPYYTSPEIWENKPYGSKCDIWSIGCVIYEMAMLKPPFQAKSYEGLYRKVKAGVYERVEGYSQKVVQLIQKCLQVDERNRWSADTILTSHLFNLPIDIEEDIDSSIDLLGTIRVPRVLKLLNKQLPEAQYKKKKVTLEPGITEKCSLALIPDHDIKSLKCIKSEKHLPPIPIRESSIEKKENMNNYHQKKPVIGSFKEINERKLPKIESAKNLRPLSRQKY